MRQVPGNLHGNGSENKIMFCIYLYYFLVSILFGTCVTLPVYYGLPLSFRHPLKVT